MKKYIILLLALVISGPALSVPPAAETGNGDYESHPEMHFQFHHLDLDLEIDPENRLLSGTAVYEVSPRLTDEHELRLHAAGMEILSVTINGEETGHEYSDDLLVISIDEAAAVRRTFSLEIRYQTNPGFGIHFTENGPTWSSMLPKSNRFWLPGFDHPRTAVTTDIRLTVPAGQQAVASGNFQGSTDTDDGRTQIRWVSGSELPLSDLGFASGDLTYREIIVGAKRVRLYAENGMLEEDEARDLMLHIHRNMRDTERLLLYEYPYEAFNLIALQDDRWETRSYGAGLGFVFANRGDYLTQSALSIYAQWFGIYQRPERWGSAGATLLHQAWLARTFDQTDLRDPYTGTELEEYGSVYQNFSPDRYLRTLQFVDNQSVGRLVNTLSEYAGRILREGMPVMDWDDYARYWYNQTGLNWFDPPEMPQWEETGKMIFNVEVLQEGIGDGVVAHITPATWEYNGEETAELTVPVTVYYVDGEETRHITFRTAGDTLQINEGRPVENIAFDAADQPVEFRVNKPVTLWIHQLRHAGDGRMRKQAARELEEFKTEPDLQLALHSALNNEQDAVVEAAVIRTLAEITRGASGVQTWFLDRLDHQSYDVKREALWGLRFYHGDQIVRREVFEIISMSDDIDLVNEAIALYRYLIPDPEFTDFVDQFLREDQNLEFTHTLIRELYETTDKDFAIERTGEFLDARYPFEIRYLVFRHLDQHDRDYDAWSERVKNHLSDPDPRIRFLMAHRKNMIPDGEREDLVSELQSRENDLRVAGVFDH